MCKRKPIKGTPRYGWSVCPAASTGETEVGNSLGATSFLLWGLLLHLDVHSHSKPCLKKGTGQPAQTGSINSQEAPAPSLWFLCHWPVPSCHEWASLFRKEGQGHRWPRLIAPPRETQEEGDLHSVHIQCPGHPLPPLGPLTVATLGHVPIAMPRWHGILRSYFH